MAAGLLWHADANRKLQMLAGYILLPEKVEGLLLPGVPPNRAYLIIKQRGPNRYHWHL